MTFILGFTTVILRRNHLQTCLAIQAATSTPVVTNAHSAPHPGHWQELAANKHLNSCSKAADGPLVDALRSSSWVIPIKTCGEFHVAGHWNGWSNVSSCFRTMFALAYGPLRMSFQTATYNEHAGIMPPLFRLRGMTGHVINNYFGDFHPSDNFWICCSSEVDRAKAWANTRRGHAAWRQIPGKQQNCNPWGDPKPKMSSFLPPSSFKRWLLKKHVLKLPLVLKQESPENGWG